jgi:DHA2 family multidrug resistance protein
MIFLPLSLATFGPLPKSEVSSASGFYNLTRQLGGSVGIAILATILAQRETFHRAILSQDLSAYSPQTQLRLQELTGGFVLRGSSQATAYKQALAVLDRTLNVQSAVLSFGDMFFIVAVLFALTLLLLFLLGSGKNAKVASEVH